MMQKMAAGRGALGATFRSDMFRTVLQNISARGIAMLALAASTVLVARVGGPPAVGAYALLRILPGLVGVVCVAGLPGALAYFLAEPRRSTPRLWPTVAVIVGAGAVLGTILWVVASPLMARVFFREDSVPVVALAGATVGTQLVMTVGKTALQGLEDRRGGDAVIAAEEVAFLPCYLVPLAVGLHGTPAIIVALALADVVVAVEAWRRVSRHLGWRRLGLAREGCGWLGRPDLPLSREIASYGLRGQVGGVMTLLNLRLDFAILGAMAGPAVLGAYSVASKYAELLKLPGTAITWVSYPRLAGLEEGEAARRVRRLVLPSLVTIVVTAVPMLLMSAPVLRLLFGDDFESAIGPSRVLVLGMLLGGAAGVASGYLYGRGRPGLNSAALGVGLGLTVVLDVLLIPSYGAMGAAVASMVAYLVGDGMLVFLLLRLSKGRFRGSSPRTEPRPVELSP